MMTPSDVKATLSFSDGSPSMDLPIYKGTIGPDVIDIRKLYAQTGKFTYDPGFLSTRRANRPSPTSTATRANCCTAATRSSSSPMQLRLPRDLLPAAERRTAQRAAAEADFVKLVTNHTMVNEQMQFFLRGFRRDAHPMAVHDRAWSARCRPSITTAPTSTTRSTARSPRSA